MRKVLSPIGALALISVLAGCGRKQPDPTPEQEMNAIMQATSPFADAEIRMDDAMTRAVGVNVGDSWVRKMIEHHRGAIDMSRQVLKMNPDAEVAAMARTTIDRQTHEISHLQKLIVQGQPDPASADLYQPEMEKMHQAMMGATGTNPSQTYRRKMLEHHKGVIAMADIALANGVTGAVRDEAEKTRADHQAAAAIVEAMLRNSVKSAGARKSANPKDRE